MNILNHRKYVIGMKCNVIKSHYGNFIIENKNFPHCHDGKSGEVLKSTNIALGHPPKADGDLF